MPSFDNARDFRERVRFERRRENGDDGYGNVQYEWDTIAICAARIAPLTGSEDVQADRLAGIASLEITVRSSQLVRDVTPEDRCVNQRSGVIYNIRSVVNADERNRYLTFTVDGGVAT